MSSAATVLVHMMTVDDVLWCVGRFSYGFCVIPSDHGTTTQIFTEQVLGVTDGVKEGLAIKLIVIVFSVLTVQINQFFFFKIHYRKKKSSK